MDTLELPAVDELDTTSPADFLSDEMDLAAFRLWAEASRINLSEEGDETT